MAASIILDGRFEVTRGWLGWRLVAVVWRWWLVEVDVVVMVHQRCRWCEGGMDLVYGGGRRSAAHKYRGRSTAC